MRVNNVFHLFGVKETGIFSIYTKEEREMWYEFNKKEEKFALLLWSGQLESKTTALSSYCNVEKIYFMLNDRPSSLKSDLI